MLKCLLSLLVMITVFGCDSDKSSSPYIPPEELPSETIEYIDPPANANIEGRVYIEMDMPYELDDISEMYTYADNNLLPDNIYFVWGDLAGWFFQSIGYSGTTVLRTSVTLNSGASGSNEITYNVIGREIISYETSYDFIYNAKILCSDVDSQNNLWFGTSDGLIRFNGEVFEQIGLQGNSIADLKVDQTDKVWMLIPSNQLATYENGIVTTYDAIDGDIEANIQSYKDRLCVYDGSIVYFTENKHLWSFDGSEFEIINFSTIYHLGIEENNDLWYISDGGVYWYLHQFSGNNVISSVEVFHPTGSYTGIDLHGDIIIDDDNTKWFNIYNTLYKYDDSVEEVIHQPFFDPDAWAYGTDMDSDGYIWLATYKQGLHKIDNQSIYQYNETNCFIQSLPDNRCVPIQSLTIDYSDNIWIAIGDEVYTDHGQIIQVKKLD